MCSFFLFQNTHISNDFICIHYYHAKAFLSPCQRGLSKKPFIKNTLAFRLSIQASDGAFGLFER